MDMKFDKGDKIIAISEDDDTIIMNSSKSILNENAILLNGKFDAVKEKTLILGWNKKASIVVKELDNYSTPGSELNIIADHPDAESQINGFANELKNFKVKFSHGHISDRNVLEKLNITEYNHIIILCYYDIMEHEDADSITLICLLHLRNISEKLGVHVSIVSEILDINNKELAEVTKADDFSISNQLISLMLSQLSENKKLKHVFDDLFDPEGSEIYLKPASGYIKEGEEVNFYTVTEAAARKNEVAIGYRQNKYRFDEDKQYGVVVNPKKSDKITFEKGDKVIVLAEE
jgi:voltage-gated potassium channel Kch